MVSFDRGADDVNADLPKCDSADLLERLEALPGPALDRLPFGVIGFDSDERVVIYNATESEMAGIEPKRVIGAHLFTEVAPCTNNYLVAERYRCQDELDEQLDYVFTLRMRPTPVRLRLLAHPEARHRYLVVTWAGTDRSTP